jgi:homoserine O-acetyltransferase
MSRTGKLASRNRAMLFTTLRDSHLSGFSPALIFRWGPLIGPNLAFDTTKFFVFCANVLGSPYGSASPLTINSETGEQYGPEFPLVSVRDDVRLHRLILDSLGIKSVAICIGGSMGGMQVSSITRRHINRISLKLNVTWI